MLTWLTVARSIHADFHYRFFHLYSCPLCQALAALERAPAAPKGTFAALAKFMHSKELKRPGWPLLIWCPPNKWSSDAYKISVDLSSQIYAFVACLMMLDSDELPFRSISFFLRQSEGKQIPKHPKDQRASCEFKNGPHKALLLWFFFGWHTQGRRHSWVQSACMVSLCTIMYHTPSTSKMARFWPPDQLSCRHMA